MTNIDLTILRLESAPFRLSQFVQQNLESWIESTVVDSVKSFARASGASQKYLDSIKIIRTGPYTADVILDYQGEKGEPLGIWREKGTRPHPIVAFRSPFLYFYWEKLKRYVSFRKVRHPGTKAMHIMENGAKYGMPRLRQKIISETNNFLQEMKMT